MDTDDRDYALPAEDLSTERTVEDVLKTILDDMKGKPAPQLFYRFAPLVPMRPLSMMKRWAINRVFFLQVMIQPLFFYCCAI
jgi:hypothetical protein